MRVRITPGRARGRIEAPPSKSMAHRLLIAAALSEGRSRVDHLASSEDISATIDCLRALGTVIATGYGGADVSGTGFSGRGALKSEDKDLRPSGASGGETLILPVRESGSTLRFLIPIVLSLGIPARFTGAKRLFARPLSVYEELARKEGFWFERGEDSLFVSGRLKLGSFTIPGNISSQFISGLLFALPGLPEDSTLAILPPIESRPYIDMTMAALREFGIETHWENETTIRIPGNQRGQGRDLRVEGDYSNAAFLEILNFLGGTVQIEGLDPGSLQGDRIYTEYFAALRKGFSDLDLSDCPDLGPVLFAAAAAGAGGRFTGTARLRMKESDRCLAMQEELLKFGISCENREDSFTVFPGKLRKPEEPLYGHNDHRIVMALSSLLTRTGGEIEGAEAVAKSWPEYFEAIRKLGIEVTENAVDQ